MIDIPPNMRFLCMDIDTDEMFYVAAGHGMPQETCYVYDHHEDEYQSAGKTLGRCYKYSPLKPGPEAYLSMPDEIKAKMQMYMLLLGFNPRKNTV